MGSPNGSNDTPHIPPTLSFYNTFNYHQYGLCCYRSVHAQYEPLNINAIVHKIKTVGWIQLSGPFFSWLDSTSSLTHRSTVSLTSAPCICACIFITNLIKGPQASPTLSPQMQCRCNETVKVCRIQYVCFTKNALKLAAWYEWVKYF
jgi:hypothetical protein